MKEGKGEAKEKKKKMGKNKGKKESKGKERRRYLMGKNKGEKEREQGQRLQGPKSFAAAWLVGVGPLLQREKRWRMENNEIHGYANALET